MILLWHYYWPVVAAAVIIGFAAGKIFHLRAAAGAPQRGGGRRNLVFAGGAAIAMLCAALWHGPLAAGDRMSANIESAARTTLAHYEMQAVTARLDRSPLRRRLVLSGPSDDVQQRELARIMDGLPGVSSVEWANPPTAPVMMQ